MEETQNKPTSSKKRVLEPQVEVGSKKKRKRLKKAKNRTRRRDKNQKKT